MRTVWRYEIDLNADQFALQVGGTVVHVGLRVARMIELWVEVDTDRLTSDNSNIYRVFGTGHPLPDDATHVGSVIDGPFVWHVYRLAL